jgi:RHS repeat-associated protein
VLICTAPLKMPLAETDAEGHITRYYVWSSHGLLAHLDVTDNGSQITVNAVRYYHADEQGSTLALTDEAGDVTDQFAYTPYGGVTRTGTTDTPFQWLGGIAVQNEGAGLYYMLNRYYSATTKKFISTDPKGIDGGANLYAYGNLNPLAFVDPYGLCAKSYSSYNFSSFNYTAGSYNNIISSVTGANPGYTPPNTSVTYLRAAPAVSYSKPVPTFQSYQNSPQYLQNVNLNFGMSANPITAEVNGKIFGTIGAGALGAVIAPASVSTYGAASTFALDTSIKAYAAGSAAAGAAYQTGANLYFQGAVEFYKASANPTVNLLIEDVSSGTPGLVDGTKSAIDSITEFAEFMKNKQP